MDTFTCELCNYKTFRKYDFNKHLNTKRHKSRKISLSLSSCDKKKSESRFSENFQTKTTKSEPNLSSESENLSRNELRMSSKSENLSRNELRMSSESENLSRNELRMSSNELTQKSEKKSENMEKLFNIPDKNKNICIGVITNPHEYIIQNNSDYICQKKNSYQYECQYCFLRFKSRPNLKRHLSKSCKIKKEEYERSLIEAHQKDRENLLEQHEREKEEYRKQIEKLLDKVGTTNITNTNCGNTQTNNVQLNNFGQEDLTMLTDKYMNKMVAYPYSAIPKMIKKIHFNDQYPANNNIRMLNKKDNKLQIRNNGEWQYVNKKETLQLLIEDKNYQLENYYENNKEKFDATKQDRFENFQNQVNIEDKKATDTIKKDTELVFWNSM